MVKEDVRLVEVTVLSEKAHEKTLEIIETEGIDYTISKQTNESDALAVISFPLPTRAVEPIRDRLRDQGISNDMYTIVTDPELIASKQFEQLQQPLKSVTNLDRHRISRNELHSQMADLLPSFSIYIPLSIISAILVTSGVLLGSVTVLIGSMVLSPLIWPPIAISVATVLDDQNLFIRSIKLEIVGVVVAVVSAFIFALLVKITPLVLLDRSIDSLLKISSYTAPPFLLVVIALSAGTVGALSLGNQSMTGLVGMVVAVAVVLPIGVLGTALAWGRLTIVVGTSAVVLLNLLSVTLTGTLTLWYMGYHPATWSELRQTRSIILKRVVLFSILILLFIILLFQLTRGDLNHIPGIHYNP
ncbi:TIGR00341 family protein [Haladaptatus halobius]|uniref:TIGR00341 family protein n=1 Tax=Haladaptatus halobius TaxID=2884875 RepID=UPI001D0A09C2|nr:TIGR00341 family protein [Haladaptatus halobius]